MVVGVFVVGILGFVVVDVVVLAVSSIVCCSHVAWSAVRVLAAFAVLSKVSGRFEKANSKKSLSSSFGGVVIGFAVVFVVASS